MIIKLNTLVTSKPLLVFSVSKPEALPQDEEITLLEASSSVYHARQGYHNRLPYKIQSLKHST